MEFLIFDWVTNNLTTARDVQSHDEIPPRNIYFNYDIHGSFGVFTTSFQDERGICLP